MTTTRMRLVAIVLIALASANLALPVRAPAAGQPLLIENVTVLSPEQAQPRGNRYVLVRDGRIATVSERPITAPDARKLDLEDVAKDGRGSALLEAMAADLAAIHVASASVKRIQKDLGRRPSGWLASAASKAEEIVRADHQVWKAHKPPKRKT